MNREEALKIIEENVANKNIIKHMLATEAVMGALAKKLAEVSVERVLNRFREPKFAAGTRREEIKMCEEHLGISLAEFVKINLEAMQKIALSLEL